MNIDIPQLLYNNDSNYIKAIRDICEERVAQQKKWGFGPNDIANPDGDILIKLAALMEEVGEVGKAICEGESPSRLYAELVQVAAVCAAWMQGLNDEPQFHMFGFDLEVDDEIIG